MRQTFVRNGMIRSFDVVGGKVNTCEGGVFNPTLEQFHAAGWQDYVAPEPTLEDVKAGKIAQLEQYDASEAVNEFFLGNLSMWLDKATRVGLMLRFSSEEAAGIEVTTLWYGSDSFALPVQQAMAMLSAVEIYASAAYDCTASHRAAILNLSTKEDVEAYDFTTGYPEKLTFQI